MGIKARIALSGVLILSGCERCSRPRDVLRGLERQGMSLISISSCDEPAPWKCGNGVTRARFFTAMSSDGKKRRGSICCPLGGQDQGLCFTKSDYEQAEAP